MLQSLTKLLDCLNRTQTSAKPLDVIGELDHSQLLAVLKLSHMWAFIEIKNLIISKLQKSTWQSCIDQIIITHKYDIGSWYLSAYMKLAKRESSITVEEAEKLGLVFAIKMAGVREREKVRNQKELARPSQTTCSHCGNSTSTSGAAAPFSALASARNSATNHALLRAPAAPTTFVFNVGSPATVASLTYEALPGHPIDTDAALRKDIIETFSLPQNHHIPVIS